MRVALNIAIALLMGLAGQPHAATLNVESRALTHLMQPLLNVPASERNKLVVKFFELRRVVVPLPALVVFFDEAGCMTAAVEADRISLADGVCIPGEALPRARDFLVAIHSESVQRRPGPLIIVFSPLFQMDRMRLMFPSIAEKLERDASRLGELSAALLAAHENATVIEVAVGH